MPEAVEQLLLQNVKVMPAELPREMLPRRDIDHMIELLPGARPPAEASCRMALLELAELQRQLDELLTASFIQHSKAPFGTLVLF